MKSVTNRSSLFAALVVLFFASFAGVVRGSAQTGAPPSPAATTISLLDRPWEYGPVVQGGFGTGDRASFKFFSAGIHAGKVLSPPALPGLLRGQFEYAGEIFPLWQSYTPAAHLATVTYEADGQTNVAEVPFGGGTFTGISITPIILRWDFEAAGRLKPFAQGAGGLIWTNHKYPPDYLVPHGAPGGTSVFNFTPQFGVGFNYFVGPKRSISFLANAIHISSASLGDRNPGVNASVQFELGYSWWK